MFHSKPKTKSNHFRNIPAEAAVYATKIRKEVKQIVLNIIKRFLVEEDGISSVEYAILLAFVAVGLITCDWASTHIVAALTRRVRYPAGHLLVRFTHGLHIEAGRE
jgi:Flp pilus assembly pilin Flp